MKRREDWPLRLAEVVASATSQPYVLGVHDCLKFSCDCVNAMTGVNYWQHFVGYRSRREALRTILKIAPSLELAVSKILELEPSPKLMAQRGDLLLYRDDAGEHLGVCLGGDVAVLGGAGLQYVPIDSDGVKACWRVG